MTTRTRWWGRVTYGSGSVATFGALVERLSALRVLVVAGRASFRTSGAERMLDGVRPETVIHRWSDFDPNTSFEDVKRGLEVAREFEPDLIVGAGGGSAMDMAKLLTAYLDRTDDLEGQIRAGRLVNESATPLVLIPTTSGSGSEATHFAVVYIGDVKFSVAGDALRAAHVILDPDLSLTGSPRQRATSGIDAICQAVESLWAVGGDADSTRYARHALGLLIPAIRSFVSTGDGRAAAAMAIGSHLSGRAIDISKTTGAHALSYFLTKRFGVPHGNAVALTLPGFIDAHGLAAESTSGDQVRLPHAMRTITRMLSDSTQSSPARNLEQLLHEIGLIARLSDVVHDLDAIVDEWIASVNLQRLSNNPVAFTADQMSELLHEVWARHG